MALQPPHSLKKSHSYSATEHPKARRRELSSISDAPHHGILPLDRGRLPHIGTESVAPDGVNAAGRVRPAPHGILGARPSNRSDAAQLSAALSQQLEAAPRRNFRAEKHVYDEVFKAVCEQVSVHCSERGDVLERLRAFYTRSTDLTARVAEKNARDESAQSVFELEKQVRALQAENQWLKQRQIDDETEVTILRLFRELPIRKQVRTLGVLYAEAGSLLMMNAADETFLSAAEQAATMNHLLLSHTDDKRAEVLSELVAITPVSFQIRLLRRLLGAMPMAEQIRMSMSILVPEQHRQIMMGIFDSAPSGAEKSTLLLEVLHSMQPNQLVDTLAQVLSATKPDNLISALRLTVASMAENESAAFLAEVISLFEPDTSVKAIKQWATDLMAKQERAAAEAVALDEERMRNGKDRRRGSLDQGRQRNTLSFQRQSSSRDTGFSEHRRASATDEIHTLVLELQMLLGHDQGV